MARLFVTGINLNKNELQNAVIQNLSSAPSSPVAGQLYYNTSGNVLYFYNGAEWVPASGSTEVIQDIVGAMVSSNTETGITVTYEDSDGTLDFAVADQFPSHSTTDLAEGTNLYYTAERVQDEINNTIVAGAGLDKTYDDQAGTYTLDIDSTVTTNTGAQTLTNKTLGSGTSLGANLDASNNKIINLGTPTDGGDAVNKAYVDGLSGGLDWKTAVHLLAATNVPLTGSTGLVIDGHDPLGAVDTGYRLLLKGQTTDTENGIYVYSDDGSTYTLTRAADADAFGELVGAAVFVMEGNTYAATSWVQSNHYITNFANQSWVQFSGAGTYTAGAGLTLTGSVFSADVTPTAGNPSLINTGGAIELKTDTSRGLSVDANGVGINAGTGLTFDTGALSFASGYGVRKYSADLGDGSATSFTVTHNFATRDVTVQVFENNTPYAQVEADVEHTTSNTATIKFAVAPTNAQYRVVVVG